jgi:hypothetical protein
MNEKFLQYALQKIESSTPAEIKAKADEIGLELVSIHSGKPLSEIPYDDIWVGMEVISKRNIAGKVILKIDKQETSFPLHNNWIRIEWVKGLPTSRPHSSLNNVKVN